MEFPLLPYFKNDKKIWRKKIFPNSERRYISTTIFCHKQEFEFENIVKRGPKL